MGLEIKPTGFRLEREYLAKLDELVIAFTPVVRNRTAVLRIAIDVTCALVFTRGTVQAALAALQRALCSTLYVRKDSATCLPYVAGEGGADKGDEGTAPLFTRRSYSARVVPGTVAYPITSLSTKRAAVGARGATRFACRFESCSPLQERAA